MQTKLQELTDRLYSEGLAKGKEEGEQILSQAKTQAEKLIADAEAKAAAIVANAQKQAEDLKSKAASDVKMASEQALQATKKDIEDLVITKITDKQVSDALSSSEYLKEIIKTVAEKFSAENACDIALLLPEKMRAELEPWVGTELQKAIGKGVEASFSKKLAGGFTIAPKDGGYFISLTDETFKALIAEYLRPVTKKLIFG